MAFTTSIGQQVSLPDGQRGWVRTRAVDVWTLDGPRLRLLRTIPIGGYADQRPALLVMERDGRHALVGVQPGGFVNEISGISHLYFPRNAPPRLLRVDLATGRVVAQTEAMLPQSRDGRSAGIGDMALDPQGRFIAMAYGGGGPVDGPDGVLLFDPTTAAPICNIGLDGRYVERLAISPDGTLLALSVDGMVRVLRIPASVQANAR